MADPQVTQDQKTLVKNTSDNIEAAYQHLRQVAANLSTLLAVGRATCAEIKAYNLYAMSVYNTQRGLLTAIRAAGQTDAPPVIPSPTLFAWKGVSGENLLNFDCASQPTSLSDALATALAPHDSVTQYLSSQDVKILTSDPDVFSPKVPSLAELSKLPTRGELGIAPLLVVFVCAIAVGLIAAAVAAWAHYLEVSKVQEETTARVRTQAQAFASATAARASCYQQCLASPGATSGNCVSTCSKLVDTPKLDLKVYNPQGGSSWGFLRLFGLVTLAAVGGVGIWKFRQWQRDRSYGEPVHSLPPLHEPAPHHKAEVAPGTAGARLKKPRRRRAAAYA